MKISTIESTSRALIIKLEIQDEVFETDLLWKERMQEAIEKGRIKTQFNVYQNNNPTLMSY